MAYLRAAGRIEPGEHPGVTRLDGGVSNRTVLVERTSGEAWVLKQALTKLRVPVDWYSSPERTRREALGLRWLARLAPEGTVPAFVFEDHGHHVLAMEAVPPPHRNWKALLLAGRVEDDHVEQFGRILGTIHRRAYEVRDEVARVFDDRTFFTSLRLEPYYRHTAANVPAAAAFLHDLIEETWAHRITLVHGDYSPKNVLVYQGRLKLLDHEVIHFGDPAFDVGFALTHLLSKANHLAPARGTFAAAAARCWQVYHPLIEDLEWAGALEARAVRHTLGCLMARVAGRSKLEYLDAAARRRQGRAAGALMDAPPDHIDELIHRFIEQL